VIIILGLSIGNSLSWYHTIKSNSRVQVLNFTFQFFIQYPKYARQLSNPSQDTNHVRFEKIIQQFQNTQRDEQQIKKLTVIYINPNQNNKILIKITKHKSKMRRDKRIEEKRNAQPRSRLNYCCKPEMESLRFFTSIHSLFLYSNLNSNVIDRL